MLELCDESKKIGYNPHKTRRLISEQGGLKTARQLINSSKLSDGFIILIEKTLRSNHRSIMFESEV